MFLEKREQVGVLKRGIARRQLRHSWCWLFPSRTGKWRWWQAKTWAVCPFFVDDFATFCHASMPSNFVMQCLESVLPEWQVPNFIL